MSDVYLWETYDKLGREALDSGDLAQANEAFRSAVATAEELQSHDRLVLSLRNLAATMMDMNQVSDAHELLVRTLEVAHQHLAGEHSQTVETQRDLAHVCQQLGYLDKADEMLKRVLEQELKLQDTDRVGSTLLSLAQVAQARQEPAVSAAYLQRVVKLKRQKLGDDHPEVAQSLLWLSTALYQCGKKDDAQRFMRKAFGLMERQFADEPTHLAQSLLAGAKMMVDAGQLEPALAHQKRALDILSAELEPDDGKLWEAREYIATTLAAMGKLEEAIEILEYCFRNGDPQGARAGATYKNLAGLYLALDKKEQAEELYEKASVVLENTLGAEHPAYLATQEERIQLYHFSGRTREALDVALKTVKATEKRFGAGHPNTAQAYASTALLAHGVEEWETALELMRAAEKIWMSLSPRPEDVLANCRTNLATCLIKLKRFDEADPILQMAESAAGPALAPVLAGLRAELEADRNPLDLSESESEADASPPLVVTEPEPEVEPSDISETPLRPTLSAPPSIIIDDPPSEPESMPELEPAVEPPEEEGMEIFGQGIDLFDPENGDFDDDEPTDLFGDNESMPEEADVSSKPDYSKQAHPDDEPIFQLRFTEEEEEEEEEPTALEVPDDTASDEADDPAPEDSGPQILISEEISGPLEFPHDSDFDDAPGGIETTDLFGDDDPQELEESSEPALAEAEDHASDKLSLEVQVSADDSGEEDADLELIEAYEDEKGSEANEEATEEAFTTKDEGESTSVKPTEARGADESKETFEERRTHPRSPLSFNRFFDVKVSVDTEGTEDLRSFLVDLGLGGIRINSEDPFPQETDITLTLPEGVLGEEVDLRAEVVWQKALYGASYIQGLSFKELSGDQKSLIQKKLDPQSSLRANSRQHFRLYRPFPIKLQAAGQEEWQASYATDLSVSGLGTRLRLPLEQGNSIRLRLELEFELPTVEVEAKVAWSKSGDNGVSHGLQFATVGPVEARTIKRYIDRCLDFLPD